MTRTKCTKRDISVTLAPLDEFPFNLDFLERFRQCEEALMPDGGWGTDAEAIVLNELYRFQETVFPTRGELLALPSWKSILKDA